MGGGNQDDDIVKLGPQRRRYGKVWDLKGKSEIAEIYISHGLKIVSIQFVYVHNGTLVMSPKYGGPSSPNFDLVKLAYPAEYLTCIRIEYDEYYPPGNAISSITFGTNKRLYGPFGHFERGNRNKFEYKLGIDRSFGGFHGSATKAYVESIGLYVKPSTQLICNISVDDEEAADQETADPETVDLEGTADQDQKCIH